MSDCQCYCPKCGASKAIKRDGGELDCQQCGFGWVLTV